MSVVFTFAAIFLLTCVKASLLPLSSVAVLLDGRGDFPSSLAGPTPGDFGRLVCDPVTDAVFVSANATEVSFDVSPRLPELSRWYIYLTPDAITGEELYTLFCDPTLSQPKVLVVRNPTNGSTVCSIVQSPANKATTEADILSRFSVEFIGAQHTVPYGITARLYSFCTKLDGAKYCFTIQDDRSIILAAATTPRATHQMFVLTIDPFPALSDVATSEALNEAVDKDEIKGQGALDGSGTGVEGSGSGSGSGGGHSS